MTPTLVTIGKVDIDIGTVQMVGQLYGDDNFLRYTVNFDSGENLEIVNGDPDYHISMKRDEFVKLWKTARFGPSPEPVKPEMVPKTVSKEFFDVIAKDLETSIKGGHTIKKAALFFLSSIKVEVID